MYWLETSEYRRYRACRTASGRASISAQKCAPSRESASRDVPAHADLTLCRRLEIEGTTRNSIAVDPVNRSASRYSPDRNIAVRSVRYRLEGVRAEEIDEPRAC